MKSLSRLLRALSIESLSRRATLMVERLRGIDFLTTIQSEEVGYDPLHVHRSSPSGGKYLTRLLSDLYVTSEDSIVDVGSGKGSAMRSMLKFPFSRVDGVELSEHIAAIATQNFRKLKANRCHVFNCDATSFQDYGRYNMFYLYNPFPDEIMSEVVCNIIRSIQKRDGETLLIYNNPACHELIISNGVFSKIKEYPDKWGNQIYVYSNMSWQHSRLNRER